MREVLLANTPLRPGEHGVRGAIVERGGEPWYRIGGYDAMPPFFIALVSGFDHWLFLSSNGGLTAGRRDPDHALFPYETDDRIHDAHATAGPVTFLRIVREGVCRMWRPFDRSAPVYRVERNLYKNLAGNRIVFEEINHDLALAFAYEWTTGDRYGFIRSAGLRELGHGAARVTLIDGIRNVLPTGVSSRMQASLSTLVDAYRQAEVEPGTGAGLYTLSSIPTDRAEPSEALRATVAWASGLDDPTVLLSLDQLDAFRRGDPLAPETTRHGRRADYLLHATFDLPADGRRDWRLLADVALGPSAVVALLDDVAGGVAATAIDDDIAAGTQRIRHLVGRADGFQFSAEALGAARHFSNTLFNVMRGGVFSDDGRVPTDDLLRFVGDWNRPLAPRCKRLLATLGSPADRDALVAAAAASGDADLERLALEYLPLTFSRRHGDPSRPWNRFTIDLRAADGSDRLSYEGNWRDIFQNWEALALSHPAYIGNFIAKFVNASTPDGHNPYRITRDGIDWEVLDPDDPWSNIGYWGDHQVIYLLNLLELSQRYHPGALTDWLGRPIFVYADVPYRIKDYDELLSDPRASVRYDTASAEASARRVREIGSDGCLAVRADGKIHHVNLFEKLLVVALARLASLVPGGGIWMNTQRPEWNDANNALVGYGLSMVTLYHLRRYVAFLDRLLETADAAGFAVSREVAAFFAAVEGILEDTPCAAGEAITDGARKAFMDRMGVAAQGWRASVYAGFDGALETVDAARVRAMLRRALALLDDSIARNRREDGLYHAYNLLRIDADGHGVEHLQEMLEGQVAVLAAGVLDPPECLDLLDSLRASSLYRADQGGYTLYPAARLPGFLEKNRVDPGRALAIPLLRADLESGRGGIIERDVHGDLHFDGRLRNADGVRAVLATRGDADAADIDAVCALFEDQFRHRRFTGRSGAMYKYEGLGCIYWHMVSKLLLATGEALNRAIGGDTPEAVRTGLARHHRAIKAGLGAGKSPADYGAFPTDPYSHTPAFAGVQQPGMTGQVKEDVISRFTELGVQVADGEVRFEPRFLERAEFSAEPATWRYATAAGEMQRELPADALAFCLCGAPVVYRLADRDRVRVHTADGPRPWRDGPALGRKWSAALFRRDGSVHAIEVELDPGRLA